MGVRGEMRMIQSAIKRFPTELLIEKAIEATLRGLKSGDARAEATAVKNVIAMELINQKDEQHFDHLRMDAGRNRVLAMLAGDGPSESPLVIEQRTEKNAVRSNPKPSQNKPGRKAQGGKRKRTA